MHDHDHDHEPLDYGTWIEQQRAGKDGYFRDSNHSPIPAAERAAFTGLPYFPIDLAFRYEGLSLEPLDAGQVVETQVQTSDGAVRDGRRVGTLAFEVDGEQHRLTALQLGHSQGNALFVPFKDATNATETYGAGRYLDIEPLPDGTYELDFNLAYSPFCAYSPSYSCPLPPPENRLTARIAAGEQDT